MTELETITIDGTTVNKIDTVPAYSLVPGDQAIIEGDLCVILTVDDDRDDIDEVFVTVDNQSGEDDSFALYADDEYVLWSI